MSMFTHAEPCRRRVASKPRLVNSRNIIVAAILFAPFYFSTFNQAVSHLLFDNERYQIRPTSANPSPFPVFLNQRHACHQPHRANLRFCQLYALLNGDKQAAKTLDPRPDRAYLSTCTAAKNAGDLLPEFIVRNYLAGVDHFIVYDNNEHSAYENVAELLRPFAPLVTITRLPSRDQFLELVGRPGEDIAVFNAPHEMIIWHCFLTYGKTTKWMLPIDADEFLEAKQPDTLHDASMPSEHIPFMQRFLREVETNVPAQIGRWDTVLTRGIIHPPPLSAVTLHEKYPIACGAKDLADSAADFNVLWASKTAVQPRFLDYDRYQALGKFFLHGVKHWTVQNSTEVKKELFFSGQYEDYTPPFNSTESKWNIVHYWSRSFGDYLLKTERGRLNNEIDRTVQELIWRENVCRNYNQSHVSKSSERRSSLVKDLLREMDGFDEIQDKYYDAAVAALRQPYNQQNVRNYEEKAKQFWPEPVS